jgi:hypothetical protein
MLRLKEMQWYDTINMQPFAIRIDTIIRPLFGYSSRRRKLCRKLIETNCTFGIANILPSHLGYSLPSPFLTSDKPENGYSLPEVEEDD